ncbi:winged helix-turn-helix transcriptional regulator [Amycolatopsis sp. NPDC004747]
MAARSYNQYCAVARTLDVVGERWSLLVVRELLDGPKRYVDLQAGLTGVSTDMLAARLRTLEQAGVITRRTLPPPAASKVYELTPLGRELRPAVTELARWGLRLLDEQREDDDFQIHWITPSLRAMFHPEAARDVTLTVEFRIGTGVLHAGIHDMALDTHPGHAENPDVVLTFDDAATLARLGRSPAEAAAAVSAGRLRVQGEADAVRTTARLFGATRQELEAAP